MPISQSQGRIRTTWLYNLICISFSKSYIGQFSKNRPILVILDSLETRPGAPTPCDQRIGRLWTSSGETYKSAKCQKCRKMGKEDELH